MARGRRRFPPCRGNPSGSMPSPAAGSRPGLVAGALAVGGFAASLLTPAQALTLGDVSLQSALGQPLDARIPVELAAGEVLTAGCVSIPPPARSDLGALPRAQVTVPETPGAGSFTLHVTTAQPLYEPMYELQVQIRCAGTPLLLRQYVLMLDLPGTAMPPPAAAAAPAPAAGQGASGPDATRTTMPAAAADVAARTAGHFTRQRIRVPAGAPIEAGSRYRVVTGDTLSTIAARIADRQHQNLWQLAGQIFAANPAAFIGDNPDLIKLGSEILIPAAGTAVPATATTTAPMTTAAAVPVAAPPAARPSVDTAPVAPAASPAAEQAPAPVAAAAPADAPPAPVFEDEAPAPTVAAPATLPVSAPATAADHGGAPAWLAVLMGVLIGAAVSLALLRDRLLAALRSLLAPRRPVIEPVVTPAADEPPAAAPVPRFNRPLVAHEPSMVVEEHHASDLDDAPLAQTDESVTVEQPATAMRPGTAAALAGLSGQEPDLPLYGEATDMAAATAELDLDLSAAGTGGTPDQDIGWIGDETALTPTAVSAGLPDSGKSDTVEQLDLQTLSRHLDDDPAISQTLRDALDLLESDYEDELTASQVVGRDTLQRILDDGDADDTLIRTGTDQFPRRR